MNPHEQEMVRALQELKEKYHVIGLKTEFEDEGTRLEEALRFKEIASQASLGLTIKIGGCGAVTDMEMAQMIGAERIVAPMIESPYALEKFVTVAKRAFPREELAFPPFARKDEGKVRLCVNIETEAGCKAFDDILKDKGEHYRKLEGIVMGRVDLVKSLKKTRQIINTDPEVLEMTRELLEKAKAHDLQTAIGGGVSIKAVLFIKELGPELLDRYETRNVIFKCPEALSNDAATRTGIRKAVRFELLWLKYKNKHYGRIADRDIDRIRMIEDRFM